jgi:hypothetical protein
VEASRLTPILYEFVIVNTKKYYCVNNVTDKSVKEPKKILDYFSIPCPNFYNCIRKIIKSMKINNASNAFPKPIFLLSIKKRWLVINHHYHLVSA